VKTYDAHKKEFFDLFALLIWTIHDFLGYANGSGWSTKGFLACPNGHQIHVLKDCIMEKSGVT